MWRRSYDTPPPALEAGDPRSERGDRRYAKLEPAQIPLTECLKDTVARVVPFWQEVLAPRIQSGERIVIAAHGNSIRALVKYLDNIADDAIVGVNIPNGIPLVYELDAQLQAHPQLLPGRCRSRRQSGCRRGRARQSLSCHTGTTPLPKLQRSKEDAWGKNSKSPAGFRWACSLGR